MTGVENFISLQDNYIGNIIAVILSVTLIIANYGKQNIRKREYKMAMFMLVNIILYSITETLSYLLDGMQGTVGTVVLYILNSVLFEINLILGYVWVRFISVHLSYSIPSFMKKILKCFILFGLVLLIINPFVPIIFTLNNNYYIEDGAIRIVFWIIVAYYFCYTIYIYIKCRSSGGVLKYFPVWMYVVPSAIGISLEWLLNSSMISACNAIAIGSVLASLQNEEIFRDRLTGLYNRAYLEELKLKLEKTNDPYVSGMMLDLNHFKNINDEFGHTEGDQALITASEMIRSAVGSYGDVIRYAGDEFIIILNIRDNNKMADFIEKIREAFRNYNNTSGKPYHLSVSIGYANFNAGTQTVNEFLNTIDKNMYKNKNLYYEHKKINCRQNKT